MKRKFIASIFLWLALMFGGQFVGAFIAVLIMAVNTPDVFLNITSDNLQVLIDKLMNPMLITGVAFIFIGVLIKVCRIENENKSFKEKFLDYINLHPLKDNMSYLEYFCFGLLINVVLSYVLELIYSILNIEGAEIFLTATSLLSVFAIAFLVPIGEEILYRNRIYNSLMNISPQKANILQSLIFGISHGNIIQGIYTFVFGMIFGHVNEKQGSIAPSICMHCGINFYAAISLYSPQYLIILQILSLLSIPMIIRWIQTHEIK